MDWDDDGGKGREKRTGCCLLEALALEDVPEVTAATRAGDLDAGHTPALVLMAGHSAGNSYTTTTTKSKTPIHGENA